MVVSRVMPKWDETAGGWVQSRLTMQIYLNSHGKDFQGGQGLTGKILQLVSTTSHYDDI